MGLDIRIMTCIHHYGIIQSIFHCPKNPLCSTYLSPALTPGNLFTVSIVLTFPEYHIDGVIGYVDFSDWLFSLSSMHLRFLHVFSCFDGSLIFNAESYSIVWMDHR